MLSPSRVIVHSAARLLVLPVAYFIVRQRNRLRPAAIALSDDTKNRLLPYFSAAALDRTRIVESAPLPIPNPPFYSQLLRLGLNFPSPATVAAITLDSVIASRVPMCMPLLFHELVHVVQFQLLGVRLFSRLYLQGFLAGGSYEGIPLERCAFELGYRFENSAEAFSVEAEIQNRISRKLF